MSNDEIPFLNQLWPNNSKTDDRHPDMKGTVEYAGQVMDLAAWKRTTKGSGREYLYIKLSEYRPRPAAAAPQPQRAQPAAEPSLDDEIPF